MIIALVIPFPGIVFLYNQQFGSRIDLEDSPLNLTIEDYKDLTRKPISFKSDKDQTLRGYLYQSKKINEDPLGLIIFSHGLGGGHEEYMEVLNYFAQGGFLVLGFDNTGTYHSDGDSLVGLSQATIDLAAAIDFVENNDDLCSLPRLVCGHSMGGYSSCAVLNYEVAVDGVATFAGFNRPQDIILDVGIQNFGSWVKIVLPYITAYEYSKFGRVARYLASEGIDKSAARVFVIHGDCDDMISLDSSIYRHYAEGSHPRVEAKLVVDGAHDLMFGSGAFDYWRSKYHELYELVECYGGEEDVPSSEMAAFKKSVDREMLRPVLNFELLDEVLAFFKTVVEELAG